MSLNFKDFFSKEIRLTVQIDDPPSQQPAYISLNRWDNLKIIREKLKNVSNIQMDDTLSFAKKNGQNTLARISHKDEENFYLYEIIDKDNILYLSSRINWKFLNEKCKLDYGCTMTVDGIEKAKGKNRAVIMKNCKLTEIGAEGCRTGKVEFKSNEDWIMKKNLFFTSDIVVENFAKLGISMEKLQSKHEIFETNSSYHYTNYGKVLLEFREYLSPTTEFINAVQDA